MPFNKLPVSFNEFSLNFLINFIDAPKLDTTNQQIKNTGAGTVTADSIHIQNATSKLMNFLVLFVK